MAQEQEDGRVNATKVILATIGLVGLIGVAVLAPNALQAIPKLIPNKRHYRYYLPQVIKRLENKGFIKIVKSNNKNYFQLTKKGRELLEQYKQKEIQIKKPKKWDGKYRVVIFDIKEYKRSIRDQIRKWLEHLGFVRLQNSVWVHPYECQEIVALLKANHHIGKEILYMTVDEIENDYWLKKAFDLV